MKKKSVFRKYLGHVFVGRKSFLITRSISFCSRRYVNSQTRAECTHSYIRGKKFRRIRISKGTCFFFPCFTTPKLVSRFLFIFFFILFANAFLRTSMSKFISCLVSFYFLSTHCVRGSQFICFVSRERTITPVALFRCSLACVIYCCTLL